MKTARKKRTREHIIADLSVNYLERIILECGFSADRTQHDYGYDLVMSTYNSNGEIESGFVTFQLKATDSIQKLANGEISFKVDVKDLNLWVDEVYPVFLVVYDAVLDEAYWLYIQVYLRDHKIDLSMVGKTLTVHISPSDEINKESIFHFRELKNSIVRKFKEVIRFEHEDKYQ